MKFTDDQVRMLTGYGDRKAAAVLTDEERKRCLVIADATEPGRDQAELPI